MVVFVGNGPGRTDKGTGEACNAVFGVVHRTQAFFLIKAEYLCRADVNAHLTAPACLIMDYYFDRFCCRHLLPPYCPDWLAAPTDLKQQGH